MCAWPWDSLLAWPIEQGVRREGASAAVRFSSGVGGSRFEVNSRFSVRGPRCGHFILSPVLATPLRERSPQGGTSTVARALAMDEWRGLPPEVKALVQGVFGNAQRL